LINLFICLHIITFLPVNFVYKDGETAVSQTLDDARKVIEIARDYAARSMQASYWGDVLECEIDKETNDWKVVFTAAPGLLAPYYKYEIFVDPKTGSVKRARKIER